MKIEIKHLKSGKTLHVLEKVNSDTTIADVKKQYAKKYPKYYVDRQQLKLSQERGAKTLADEEMLGTLKINDGGVIFFKDLGPQIGWTTVFLCEYAGPLVVYLLFFFFPNIFYSDVRIGDEPLVVKIAAVCWSFHYAKRLLETIFIHRFSHATMPISNLFKNCSYYWGFAAFVSYFVNHPLYSVPSFGAMQIYGGLVLFVICEAGNYSIHVALRDLRPPGSRDRKIPYPNSNPLCILFKYVSCPNYTYEVGSWVGFTLMTQTLSAFLFTFAGFYQMAVWAQGKHRRYRKEFKDYPRGRKAIVPFLI